MQLRVCLLGTALIKSVLSTVDWVTANHGSRYETMDRKMSRAKLLMDMHNRLSLYQRGGT